MKHFLLLLLAVVSITACGTARRISADPSQPWVGSTTTDILTQMGDPDRIDDDGKGGSILVYESAPDYNSPDYDILDPDTAARTRKYARFYLDREGVCYQVDTNRNLPSPRIDYADSVEKGVSILLDVLFYLPLFSILILL